MAVLKRILIADDEEDISWGISKNIANAKLNIEIECVDNGDRVLERLAKRKFDLVISDIRMPGRNGLQLILDIRKLCPDTKIIIMTAYGSPEVMEIAENRGTYFYIEKPFDMRYLKEVVLEALSLNKDGFRGVIDGAGIRDLVEMNCASKSSSALVVSQKDERGRIYFRNGDVVHAECGELRGERAFYNIMNWGHGTFEINNHELAKQRTILRDWKTLLHQCL